MAKKSQKRLVPQKSKKPVQQDLFAPKKVSAKDEAVVVMSKTAKPAKAAVKESKAKVTAPKKAKEAHEVSAPVVVTHDTLAENVVAENTPPENSADEVPEKKKKERTRETAESMSKRQRDISISEFFTKNRHLLGFDNPRRALLTTIKEAVDNSLDACEEAAILPDLDVQVTPWPDVPDRFTVRVRDNGPGIVKKQIPNVFGKLLYGSKFHRLKMARGQQGIGISAAGMYGQLTTGRPVRIISKIGAGKPAHYYEITIDTQKNEPRIEKDSEQEWDLSHGTQVEIDLEAKYQKGRQSVDEYIEQTAIANPHLTIRYEAPDGEKFSYERTTNQLPPEAREIKPHPYGVELGMLIKMLQMTKSRSIKGCLQLDFSRVSSRIAAEILKAANIGETTRPGRIVREEAEKLLAAMQATKIMNPPADCISPIGEELILSGLKKVPAEFYTSVTRSPSVYRGNPFLIEVGIAYGCADMPADGAVRLLRYANRVPLLYQPGACAITEAVCDTAWKSYGLQQSGGNLPVGPAVIFVHVASVWVPFTSESKEAIAHYPEIIKEIKLGVQECGRRLSIHVSRRRREADAEKKKDYISSYIPHISNALRNILALGDKDEAKMKEILTDVLEKSRQI